ncbi:MAG: hypothetical protein WD066_04895 [Planctomycetaceae bacterium]
MKIHGFEIVFDGIEEWSDDDAEWLYEAGCDDGTPGVSNGIVKIAFGREAESFVEAVSSAMRDVGKSGVKARIARIVPDDPADRADADEFNRLIAALGRFQRADVHSWPVGRVASPVES